MAIAALIVGCSESATAPTSVETDTVPASTIERSGAATTRPQTTAGIPPAATTPTTTAGVVQVSVTGVVIDIVGALAGIDSFTLRLSDGTDLELAPGEGLLFDDAAPISHLRDHLISGAPVTATYLETNGGRPVVIAVGDAEGGDGHGN